MLRLGRVRPPVRQVSAWDIPLVSIRVRLLLLVLATALLPVLLVGWRYYQDRGKGIDQAINGLVTTARGVAASIDTKIQGTAQLHLGLSQARDLSSGDKARCSIFLAEVLAKNTQFTGILTINPDGSLFCDSLGTGRALDLRDRDYFRRALKTSDSVVVEPVFGRLTNMAVLQIAYPTRDERQRLRFVLLASLDLGKLVMEQTGNLPQGTEILLVDGKGTVLGRSPAQAAADRPGSSIANAALFHFASGNAGGARELVDADGESRV